MKFISDYPELKGITFDTVEACEAEEKKVDAAKAEAAKQEQIRENTIMAKKEELKQYAKAKVEARENFAKARKDAQAAIAAANAEVAKAHKALIDAIKAYNEKVDEVNELSGVHRNRVDAVEFDPEDILRMLFGIG
jgi:hypothetical protein